MPSSGGLASGLEDDVLVLPFNDQEGVERLLESHGGRIAALLVEPFSNRAGITPAAGFYDFLRDITQTYGILLIFDEVISFRVGPAGAQGRYGGEPDLTAFGKIMGGGLPVGATGGRREVMALRPGARPRMISGGTYSGNPVTSWRGRRRWSMTPDAFARLDALGDRLRTRMTELFRAAGQPGQATGAGSLFQLVLTGRPVKAYRDLEPGPPSGARPSSTLSWRPGS